MDINDETMSGDQRRGQGESDMNELVMAETTDLTDDARTNPHKHAALPPYPAATTTTTTANPKKRTFNMTEDYDPITADQARVKRPQLAAAGPKTNGPAQEEPKEGGELHRAYKVTAAAPRLFSAEACRRPVPRTPEGCEEHEGADAASESEGDDDTLEYPHFGIVIKLSDWQDDGHERFRNPWEVTAWSVAMERRDLWGSDEEGTWEKLQAMRGMHG